MADLNVPAGWRVRGDDELVEKGDRYWRRTKHPTDFDMCDVSIGQATSTTVNRYGVHAILTQKPHPAKPIFPGGDMQWLNYSVEQRREFNRAAYEALGTHDVEMFERFTGTWKPSSQVSLFFQSRVKPPEPLVRWLVQYADMSEDVLVNFIHTEPGRLVNRIVRMVETTE